MCPPPLKIIFSSWHQITKLKRLLKSNGALVLQCSVTQTACIEKLFVTGSKLHGLGNQFLHMALYEYCCDGRKSFPDFSSFFMIGFKDEEPTWLNQGTQQLPPPPANKFVRGNIYPNCVPHICNIPFASRQAAVYCKHSGRTPIHPVNHATAIELFRELLNRYVPIVEDDVVLDLNAHCGKFVIFSSCTTN